MTSNTISKSISILIFMGFLSFSTKPFEEMNTIKVRKIEDFEITGNENTNHWKAAEWIKLTQRKSEGGSYGTQVKIQYSDRGIYFLFLCEDSKITSTMKEDNLDLWTEDVVEIFLWTDGQYPLYFEYELSPMNYELPLLIPNMEGKFRWKSPPCPARRDARPRSAPKPGIFRPAPGRESRRNGAGRPTARPAGGPA